MGGVELFLKQDLLLLAKEKCPTSVSARKIQAQQFDMTLIYLLRDLESFINSRTI